MAFFVVFALCFAGYLANLRALTEADCVPAPYTAWALVQTGSFDVGSYPYLEVFRGGVVIPASDGGWVSRYPPGSSLAAVPFVAPLVLLFEEPVGSGAMRRVGKLTAAVCVALAAALFFLIMRQVAPSGAVAATILFAFGTSAWSVASQALWMHGPALLWLCLALWFLTRDRQASDHPRPGGLRGMAGLDGMSWMAGVAHGLAILTRPTSALFAGASVAALLWKRDFRGALGVGLGSSAGVALLMLYNGAHFESPIAGGYGSEAGLWNTPFATGLYGLLGSPSRGLFVYSPALLLAPLGVWRLFGPGSREPGAGDAPPRQLPSPRDRALLAAWCLAAVATIVLYSRWHAWWGGWSFGPRLLAECLPVACVLFGAACAAAGAAVRRAARIAIVASIAVHFLGVFGDNTEWLKRHPEGEPDFSWRDTQIESHFRALFGLPPAGEPPP